MKNPRMLMAALGLTGALGVGSYYTADHEGLSLDAYLDSVGVPTICYGRTQGVQLGDTYTLEQCEQYLKDDLYDHAIPVWQDIDPTEVTLGVFISVSDFVYNVGVGNYNRSTLRQHLRAGELELVCQEFPRWKYAGGVDCSQRDSGCYGVWLRRLDQQQLCESGLPLSE